MRRETTPGDFGYNYKLKQKAIAALSQAGSLQSLGCCYSCVSHHVDKINMRFAFLTERRVELPASISARS